MLETSTASPTCHQSQLAFGVPVTMLAGGAGPCWAVQASLRNVELVVGMGMKVGTCRAVPGRIQSPSVPWVTRAEGGPGLGCC